MTRREAAALLSESGVPDADTDARLLFTHFGGVSSAYLLANPDFSLDSPAFREALLRRKAREPLAYILGEAPFFTELYTVSEDCLIPRFDTELLVEKAASLLPRGAHFADLCTGSGCVAVSTLRRRSDTTADAYEISSGALSLAQENAEKNGVAERVHLNKADLLCDTLPKNTYDAILSNPPYIPTRDLDALSPEVQSEPRIALDGGEDGLLFYRRFLTAFRTSLKTDGFFLFEIGYDLADAMQSLADEYGLSLTLFYDLGGNPRVVLFRKTA